MVRNQRINAIAVLLTTVGCFSETPRGEVREAGVDASFDVSSSKQDATGGDVVDDVPAVAGNCRLGDAMSILARCTEIGRQCVDVGEGLARCGACVAGRVAEGADCRVARTCEAAGCAAQRRVCSLPPGQDARCGECLPGFRADPSGMCVAAGANCTALAESCRALRRVCVEGPSGASCGGCESGTLEDPGNSACVMPPSCTSLNCERQQRSCDSSGPMVRCGSCLRGFVEAGGECRARMTCAMVTCPMGQQCDERDPLRDAICTSDAMTCGEGEVFDRFSRTCVSCPASCAGGPRARGETGRPHPETVFVGEGLPGRCICETEPGFFADPSGIGGTLPCDADNDGWVQAGARAAVEIAETDMNRQALRVNARCRVRRMSRVELVNDLNDTYTEMLPEPVALYESRRLDDDALLSLDRGVAPIYNGVRALGAVELNSLTKACASVLGDHNDNLIEDVRETDTTALVSGAGGTGLPAPLLPLYRVYQRFSYFVEANRGRYVPDDTTADEAMPTTGPSFIEGRYRIEERSRTAMAPGAVGFTYASTANAYWRQCIRRRDAEFSEMETSGMDLARYTGSSFRGMNHHSQFRCLQFVADTTEVPPTARYMLRTSALRSSRTTQWTVNSCSPGAMPGAGAARNPADAGWTCTVSAGTPMVGTVAWGLADYVPYTDATSGVGDARYVRGCINECLEQSLLPMERRCTAAGGECFAHDPRFGSVQHRFGQVQCCQSGQAGCRNTCCGIAGVTAQVCRDGACVVGSCNSGLFDCDGNSANGCESRGTECWPDRDGDGQGNGGAPSVRQCSCPPGTVANRDDCNDDRNVVRICGGRCVDIQVDNNNCGACGASCGSRGVCVSGRCEPCGARNERCCLGGWCDSLSTCGSDTPGYCGCPRVQECRCEGTAPACNSTCPGDYPIARGRYGSCTSSGCWSGNRQWCCRIVRRC